MIDRSRINRFYVAMYKVDFRKSFDGLLAEAFNMGLDPLAGDLIIFPHRNGYKIKVLLCDNTGMWVLSKRFYEKINLKAIFSKGAVHKGIAENLVSQLLTGQCWQRLKNELS